jgi:DNA primase
LIPPEKIAEIRDRADIVAVVGEYVPLRRVGSAYLGLCPFHAEKSPSFNVRPDRHFFRCFGCGAAGDVVSFVMKIDGVPFPEAARKLAERFGVELPKDDPRDDVEIRRAKAQRERLYATMDLAAGYYIEQLTEHPLGHMAREVIASRNVGEATAEKFRLGYAPDGWDGLASYLSGKDASLRDAADLGLIAPRRDGNGYYDRFRHRLMFPISDAHGRIVAFSGRILADPPGKAPSAEPSPKYVNSPETALYKKGEILYGLYEGRVALRREGVAVLCEGNFDLVALHQAGFEASVAPMGTALTPEQAKLLRRYAEKAILLFDGDKAGRKAVHAAYPSLRDAAISAQVAVLPEGEDPDTFLRKEGAAELKRRFDTAPGIVTHLIDEAAALAGVEPEARARAIAALGPVIIKIDSPVEARLYIERIAQRFGITDVESVRRQLRSGIRASRGAPERAQEPSPAPEERRKPANLPGLEAELIGLLLDQPGLLGRPEASSLYELLTSGDLRDIFQASVRTSEARGGIDAPTLLEALDGHAARAWLEQRLGSQVYEDEGKAAHALENGIQKLAQQTMDRARKILAEQIVDARRRGDENTALALTAEYNALLKNAHQIKSGKR